MLSPDRGSAAASRPDVHAAAAEGVRSGGGRLPHGEKIQRSFGGYDISNVIAHTGAAAEHASAAMGASAYATGNDVVLGKGGTDLHTVAHEAAHVVQQRAGVSLSGGVGQAGDPYERHADAVADLVVQGKSAEGLLGEMAGGGGGGTGVQMRESEPVGDSPPEAGVAAEPTSGNGGPQAPQPEGAVDSATNLVEVEAPRSPIGLKAVLDIVDDAQVASTVARRSLFSDLGPKPHLPSWHQDALDSHLTQLLASTTRSISTTNDSAHGSRLKAQAERLIAGRSALGTSATEHIDVPNVRLSSLTSSMGQLEETNTYSKALFERMSAELGVDLVAFLKAPTRGEELSDGNARADLRSKHFKQDAKGGQLHSVDGVLKNVEGPDQGLEAAMRTLKSAVLNYHAVSWQLSGKLASFDAAATGRQRDRLEAERNESLASMNFILNVARSVNSASRGDVAGAVLQLTSAISGAFISDEEFKRLSEEVKNKTAASDAEQVKGLSTARKAAVAAMGAAGKKVEASLKAAETRDANIGSMKQGRRMNMAAIGTDAIPMNRGKDADLSAKLLLVGAILEMSASARHVRSAMEARQITPEDLGENWRALVRSRERNPASADLRYVFSAEEAVAWNAGRLGTWAHYTPGEFESHRAAMRYVARVDAIVSAVLDELGPHAESAQATLDEALAVKDSVKY